MRWRDLLELCVLALLWGSAYLFIRAAVPEFGPVPLIALRLGLSALVLAPLLVLGAGGGTLRRALRAGPADRRRPLVVQGVLLSALPFVLLAWASLSLTAGLTSILNATAPLFAAIVAHLWLAERIGPLRAAGLAIGFAGVGLLAWGDAGFRDGGGVGALLAVLVASMLWGIGGHYTRVRLTGLDPIALSVATLTVSATALAPLAAATWPATPPSARAWAELAFLGIASSGLGFLLYYRLLRNVGAVRATSVTLLNPPVSMIGGALYLGEPITLRMVAGAAVILAGTGLALGLYPRRPGGGARPGDPASSGRAGGPPDAGRAAG